MEQPSFAELFDKYINNACSPEEVDELMAMLEDDNQEPATKELLRSHMLKDLPEGYSDAALQETLEQRFQQITQHIQTDTAGTTDAVVMTPRKGLWWRLSVAATILLMLGAGIWYWLKPDVTQPVQLTEKHQSDDIAPGSNKATLQLADGQLISLDSTANRTLGQHGISVVKNENGKLIYHTTDSSGNRQSVPYNKLSTPAGGQYQLLLPDGTQVWLNAASSIQFPVVFTGSERRVTVTGEVYFEVKGLPLAGGGGTGKMPFIVQVQKSSGIVQEVQVLGTHFNINAYEDEETVKTTLLEGSVKIDNRQPATGNKQHVILKPGQQAKVHVENNKITIDNNANTKQVMAWKNGLFVFDGVDLKTVLRQLARWYDVEITYEKGAPVSELFNGAIQNNLSLNQMIKGLDGMGVHVKKEGRKLLVTP